MRRTVGTRTLEAGEARVVTISQSYATDAADLWDACTNIERIPRWFLPISGDLKVGGSYQLEGHASGTDPDVRPAEELHRHLGVRRQRQLDRRQHQQRRPRPGATGG